MKTKKRKGFTLTETIVAAVLMSMLTTSVLSMSFFLSRVAETTDKNLEVYSRTDYFAREINKAIRKAGTGHLVPRSSFIEENFTANWNYIGLMNNVIVPASVSHTGKALEASNALVYVEYVGPSRPSSVPEDSNLIQTKDGYFVQHVFDYSFYDYNGNEYTFNLKFVTDQTINIASSMVTYEFETLVKNKQGEVIKNLSSDSLLSKLNLQNATQVVSHGTATDPATAIAFSTTFLPISSMDTIQKVKSPATVVFVLDFSGSMKSMVGYTGETRMSLLKKSVLSTVEDLKKNNLVNVVLVPFAASAGAMYDCQSNPKWIYPLKDDNSVSRLRTDLQSINPPKIYNTTNVGDGLRQALIQAKKIKSTSSLISNDLGKVFLILVTDGAMNSYSSTRGDNYAYTHYTPYNGSQYWHYANKIKEYYSYYYGTQYSISYNFYPVGSDAAPTVYGYARDYAKYWGEEFKEQLQPTTFLVDIAKGMSSEDKKLLEGMFGTNTQDVSSITDFENVFSGIAFDINENMWAFTGPKL